MPAIARVCAHLRCLLYEIRTGDEPSCHLIGRDLDLLDDSRGFRASPAFSRVDALEYFCAANLGRFLELEAVPALARHWFWKR
jgi:hypothetical protein